jgi:hypothetical protein
MLEHIGYEWWMFRADFERLSVSDGKDRIASNAYVESLAVHGRALIHFFYELKNSKTHDDDSLASDYGLPRPSVAPDTVIAKWKRATDKRIAHITKQRLNDDDDWNAWPTDALYNELTLRVRELEAVIEKRWPGTKLDYIDSVPRIVTGPNTTTQSKSDAFLSRSSGTKGPSL